MRRGVLGFMILALLVVVGPAFGQAQRGTVTVTVSTDDGSRLPGATVSAEADDTLTRRTAVTDAQGVATLVALDPSEAYVVTTSLDGFNTVRNESVRVRAGQDAPLNVTLGIATVREELVVTAEAPVVDVTSALTGEDITLQLTESLPTTRSYQGYLQLVPGVLPSDSGNPASRSGVNYSDIGGSVGSSSDNFYYFEGINVTDNVTGTFGANLNTEIIQEQSVITGGIPAEYAGAPGLISNVITKSGGNQFSGSLNYYTQDDSLVEDNENRPDSKFSTFDSAATFGGPIVRDKAWFFLSYRRVERDDDVVSPDTNVFLRSVNSTANQGFGKITWAPTQRDLLSGLFLNDPTDFSGSRSVTRSNARDFSREQGGERYSINYSRVFNALSFDAAITDHEGEVSDFSAVRDVANTVTFFGQSPSQAAEELGGLGSDEIDIRGTEGARVAAEYFLDSGWGDHTIKGGLEYLDYTQFRDEQTLIGPNGVAASYVSVNAGAGAESLRDVVENYTVVAFDPTATNDYNGLIDAFAREAGGAAAAASLDTNNDGTVSVDEMLDGITFSSTAGNPHNQINYYRNLEAARGAQDTGSNGSIAFIQDQWQWNRWSVNAGLRAEEWEHVATTGEDIFTFDWDIAPRLSVAYDLSGNGRQRLSFYAGRYYDPIRTNLTNFAGTLTGQRTEEQVFVNGQWFTYRFRGGSTQQDAAFVPNTATPYTDEYNLGYKRDLGRNQSFEVNLIHRRTADIIEDYDLSLYADPEVYNHQFGAPGDVDITNDPDSLFLGLDYFGLSGGLPPNINFFIATLAGGYREWDGVELIYRKRFSDNWQMLASYNYADAEGNTNSDSNADFQGDVIWLDPRAPNQLGPQPGSIEHLFKVSASYNWDNGFQLGGNYRWNSGTLASRTFRASGRNLPVRTTEAIPPQDRFEYAGIFRNWIANDTVGDLENPSYGILDLRLGYLWDINSRLDADFFIDVFNVLDNQDATQLQDLVRGGDGVAFGEGIDFVDPRRYFVGARLRF